MEHHIPLGVLIAFVIIVYIGAFIMILIEAIFERLNNFIKYLYKRIKNKK